MGRLATLKPRLATLAPRLATSGPQTTRIRGRKLQRIRDRYLSAHPLCERCREQGRLTVAVEVDHRHALINGGVEDEFDDANRCALCVACHAEKTTEDMRLARGQG